MTGLLVSKEIGLGILQGKMAAKVGEGGGSEAIRAG